MQVNIPFVPCIRHGQRNGVVPCHTVPLHRVTMKIRCGLWWVVGVWGRIVGLELQVFFGLLLFGDMMHVIFFWSELKAGMMYLPIKGAF